MLIEVDILMAVPAVKVGTEKVIVDKSDDIKQKFRIAAGAVSVAADWHNPTKLKSILVVPPNWTA